MLELNALTVDSIQLIVVIIKMFCVGAEGSHCGTWNI